MVQDVAANKTPTACQIALKRGCGESRNVTKMGQKTHFSKGDPGSFGMLKQVLLAHFEPAVMRFGRRKPQNAFKRGAFAEKKITQKYYTTLLLNLANQQQQASKHIRPPFWLVLPPTASDPSLIQPSYSVISPGRVWI